jgi:CubicO group peptidase (beta-lactamase class C family)
MSSDLYDLASCTKICATTMAAMYMVEQGKIDLEKTVKDYLSLPANNTIGNIKIKDLLLHEAGLTPFIPF